MRVYALGLAPVVGAALFGGFLWRSLFRYDHVTLNGTVHARMQRVSGRTEVVYPDGGKAADQGTSSEPVTAPLPTTELSRLACNANFYPSELSCSVYNGTSYRVNEVMVHLEVTEAGQASPVVDRDYRLKNTYFTEPLQTGIFKQYVGFTPQEGQKWSWHIKAAAGVKR